MQKNLSRPALMTISKAFVGAHLDYSDVIYDEACCENFYQKLESVQYNAGLSLLGRIRLVIPPTWTLVQETLLIS